MPTPTIYGRYPSSSWKAPVATAANLPLLGNTNGDARVTLDSDDIYIWNGSGWLPVASPAAVTAITALLNTSDVTANGPGAVPAIVNSVGGSSAANIHTAELAANSATSSSTANTIVKRDALGNFIAGTFSSINFSGSSSGSNTGDVTLSTANGLSLVGQALSLSLSSTSTTGSLTNTDWNTFNNKAPIDSPAFTGIPTAPTASVGTSTTQLATTAFVLSQGFSGATGSIPSSNVSSTTVVTSATTTYVTAISTTITITASSAPVYAKATATFTTTTAASVAKYRVSVNGVAGQEQLVSLTAVTTNFTAAVQYISASLAAGTYTVLFEIGRSSGTGTVNFFEGTLDVIALQGASSNGITSLSGLGLSAGPGSGAQALTGTLTLAGGGTNASLTAANGALVYSTATGLGITAAGSAGQIIRSAGAASPTWSTATYPATTTINQILYSSASNTITGLATGNTSALVTNSTGVPSLTLGTTANRVLRTNGTAITFAQVALATDVSGTLPFGNGGTGVTSIASGRVPFSNGTQLVTDSQFLYDTTNNRLTIGTGGGSGTLNVVPVTSTLGVNIYQQNNNHAVQIQNSGLGQMLELISATGSSATQGSAIRSTISRGTLTARTAAVAGDEAYHNGALAYYNSSQTTGEMAYTNYILTDTPSASANGGEINFATTLNGTTTPVRRVKIANSGETVFSNAIATARYTTAQKNALTPTGGWVVFDTDLSKLSYYNGTTWVNL